MNNLPIRLIGATVILGPQASGKTTRLRELEAAAKNEGKRTLFLQGPYGMPLPVLKETIRNTDAQEIFVDDCVMADMRCFFDIGIPDDAHVTFAIMEGASDE